MLPFPTHMLLSAGKDYAAWVAHITARATGGAKTWNTNESLGAGGSFITTASPSIFAGMTGSVWLAYALAGTGVGYPAPGRIARHGLPSEAEYNAQTAAGRILFFRMVPDGDRVIFYNLNRNGWESNLFADGEPYPAMVCPELAYWDGALGRAMWMNPQTGAGPFFYDDW